MSQNTITVTISADTYRRLVNLPLPGGIITGKPNPDGTVSFQLDGNLHAQLIEVNDHIDLALQTLFGLRLN